LSFNERSGLIAQRVIVARDTEMLRKKLSVEETILQRLKLNSICGACGAIEAVPFQNAEFFCSLFSY
jgi:hypothetical protein